MAKKDKSRLLKKYGIDPELVPPEHHKYLSQVVCHNGSLYRFDLVMLVSSTETGLIKEMIERYDPIRITAGEKSVFDDRSQFQCTHYNSWLTCHVQLSLTSVPAALMSARESLQKEVKKLSGVVG